MYVGNQKTDIPNNSDYMGKVCSTVKVDSLPVLNKGDVVVSATLNLLQLNYDHVSAPNN